MVAQTTEITVVVSAELEAVVIQNTQIEPTKAQAHAMAFAPAMIKVHELSKALTIMDKSNPTDSDSKIAKRMRLDLVDVRKRAEEKKVELKSMILIEGGLIDDLFKVVKKTCELTELEYASIEKFAENKEKERKQKLFNERVASLSSVCENPTIYPLGDLEEKYYNDLYEGLRLADQAKRDAQIKAENDRIKAEKQADLDRIETKRIADEQAEAQRLENIKLKEENEAKEKQLTEERLKAETERKAEAKKQAEIQAQKDSELKKQQAEKAELEKQLQYKKDAELKAETERKEQEKAEAKKAKDLLKASDKVRLNNMVSTMSFPEVSETGLSDESLKIKADIKDKFTKFQIWAKEQIEKM